MRSCGACDAQFKDGEGFGAYCSEECHASMYYEPPDPQLARDEADYQAGIADGQRYIDEKKVYGEALAERFRAMDEFAAYNRGDL